jgi:hypothetical protein
MTIYKILSGEALDEFYEANPGNALDQAEGLLANADSESVVVAAETFAGEDNLPDGAVDELQSGWLDGIRFSGGVVPGDEVDRVLRLGYREAIALARDYDPPAPIESFWVTGPGAQLGVNITAGPRRVTVFISTPVELDYGSRRTSSRSWVVRIGDLEAIDPDAPREQLDDGPVPVMKIQVSGPFGTMA